MTEETILRQLETDLKTLGVPVVNFGERLPDEKHIRWFKVTDVPDLDFDSQGFLLRVQVDVWAKSRGEAMALYQQVFDRLVEVGNWTPAPSPGDQRDNEWWRVIRDFELVWA